MHLPRFGFSDRAGCSGFRRADPGDYFVRRARWAARRVYRTIRHSSMQGFRSPVRVEVQVVVESLHPFSLRSGQRVY